MENEPEATKDTMNPTNNGNTEAVQPQVVQSESSVSTSKPVISPISEPAIVPVSASKPNPKASIPYPSKRNDERNREKANNQIEKFYQIFKDMSFEISFADAWILMFKFASTLIALIGNKEKLSEMDRTPLNEHCSAILLKLSLPDLTPTCMTLELSDRSISRSVGVAEDVYVKCMRTGSKSYPNNSNATIPRRSNKRRVSNIVEPEIRTIEEIFPMADRTLEELLQAPTEGDSSSKTDDRIDKLVNQISNLVEIVNKQVITPTTAKAVEKTCVICRGAHAYYDCIATDSNQPSVRVATGTYNQVSPPNRASNQIPPPGFAPVQNNQNRYNQNQRQGNNFNRGNNFQNNQGYRAPMNNAPNFQYQGFQNQPFQAPNNQIQPGIPNELSCYMKSNESLIRNIQNQINILRGDFNKQEENLRRNLNNDMRSILGSFFQNQASTSGTLSSDTVPNPKGEMKDVTTRSGLAYEGPSILTNSPLEKGVEQDTEEKIDKEHPSCQGSTAHIQPSVVPISIPKPDVSKTQPKSKIPYPFRLNDQKLREKATNQMEKLFQFHDLHFDISFADALLLMPKFASTIKSLLTNKDKLFELAKVPLNENYLAMLFKKLLEKLGDPGKFLIPCDFPGIDVCHALADLGANINLIPLSIWKKLSLPELTPTRMTIKLADRSTTRPKGVAEDVFIRVGKFHFPTDFVVVDFKADPRVPLILGDIS
nr:reverse transcriptase domain-containing protein [Tanacetum cinerariifolium]